RRPTIPPSSICCRKGKQGCAEDSQKSFSLIRKTSRTSLLDAALCASHEKATLTSLYDLHIPAEHFLIGSHLPRKIFRCAVDGCKIVERYERHVLHENLPGLLQQGDALFDIGDLLLFVDDFV